MIVNTILILCFVYFSTASSSFIGEGKRAELFELLDDEVGTFRIKIPDEEFSELKNKTQVSMDTWFSLIGRTEINLDGSIDTSSFVNSLAELGDDDFKTKNAVITVQMNGMEKNFKKVTFSLGGASSHIYGKQGYNLKIRGNENLFGRSQFRIRPDAREPSFLRSKLMCDMQNRIGIDSISANYITLYINDQYMGLYILMDSIKLSWVELKYGEKDTTNLYQCKNGGNLLTLESSSMGCANENDEADDRSEWFEFLTALDNAKTPEDIEPIFDIDQFLYEIALEYLTGSWDHFLFLGHNYNVYKQMNGKWKFYLYDFDADLGQDTNYGVSGFGLKPFTNRKYASYSFNDWARPRHLLDVLIFNNSTRFDNILKKVVTEVFNPAVLFPHIDELKDFIKPYVILDKTPDENGKYPGRINEQIDRDYSVEEWDANSEFTSIKTTQYGRSIGLKYWILEKYKYVCKAYKMKCDTKYTKNYKYKVNRKLQVYTDFNLPLPILTKVVNSLLKTNSKKIVNKLISLLKGVNTP